MTTTTDPKAGLHFATAMLDTTLPIPACDRRPGTQLRYEGGTIHLMARIPGEDATWLARRWDGATVTVQATLPRPA
jgi:hypothetical protein